jgi:hypothetical protein
MVEHTKPPACPFTSQEREASVGICYLEEALVEAFSLRGLRFLAGDWAREPPFPNDTAFADAILSYRKTALAGCRAAAQEQV